MNNSNQLLKSKKRETNNCISSRDRSISRLTTDIKKLPQVVNPLFTYSITAAGLSGPDALRNCQSKTRRNPINKQYYTTEHTPVYTKSNIININRIGDAQQNRSTIGPNVSGQLHLELSTIMSIGWGLIRSKCGQ